MNIETFEDAIRNIRHFIEKVYNKKRLHSALGYKSPDQFEMEAALILLLNYLSAIRGAVQFYAEKIKGKQREISGLKHQRPSLCSINQNEKN